MWLKLTIDNGERRDFEELTRRWTRSFLAHRFLIIATRNIPAGFHHQQPDEWAVLIVVDGLLPWGWECSIKFQSTYLIEETLLRRFLLLLLGRSIQINAFKRGVEVLNITHMQRVRRFICIDCYVRFDRVDYTRVLSESWKCWTCLAMSLAHHVAIDESGNRMSHPIRIPRVLLLVNEQAWNARIEDEGQRWRISLLSMSWKSQKTYRSSPIFETFTWMTRSFNSTVSGFIWLIASPEIMVPFHLSADRFKPSEVRSPTGLDSSLRSMLF